MREIFVDTGDNLDTAMSGLGEETDVVINIAPGFFDISGHLAPTPSPMLRKGWKIRGAGRHNTVVRFNSSGHGAFENVLFFGTAEEIEISNLTLDGDWQEGDFRTSAISLGSESEQRGRYLIHGVHCRRFGSIDPSGSTSTVVLEGVDNIVNRCVFSEWQTEIGPAAVVLASGYGIIRRCQVSDYVAAFWTYDLRSGTIIEHNHISRQPLDIPLINVQNGLSEGIVIRNNFVSALHTAIQIGPDVAADTEVAVGTKIIGNTFIIDDVGVKVLTGAVDTLIEGNHFKGKTGDETAIEIAITAVGTKYPNNIFEGCQVEDAWSA